MTQGRVELEAQEETVRRTERLVLFGYPPQISKGGRPAPPLVLHSTLYRKRRECSLPEGGLAFQRRVYKRPSTCNP